jgi:hypothetical protein
MAIRQYRSQPPVRLQNRDEIGVLCLEEGWRKLDCTLNIEARELPENLGLRFLGLRLSVQILPLFASWPK